MRKSTLIITAVIDDLPEELADRLQAVMHDGCPVEIIINGRHLIPAITASIQDSRENT